MQDPYPLFTVFAFLSFFVVLIPLPWHFQAWNSGTCLFMIWTAIASLNQFINSIIYHGNTTDVAPVWCDISTHIMIAAAVAIPAASLCINRRLYKIATCQTATISRAQKQRDVLVDLAIGLGLPTLQIPLQFVVQGHRYDILEDVGCFPTTVNTPPAYPLTFSWPNIIGLISAAYCVLTLRAFLRRRAQFSQFLSSTSSLTINRYFRLMALATSEILLSIPLSSYTLYLNLTARPIYPWKSWSDTHYDFFTIDIYPARVWHANHGQKLSVELSRWSPVICAIIFFAFFGFADEALKHYRLAYWKIAKIFGVSPPSKQIPISISKPIPPSKFARSTPASIPTYDESQTDSRASYHKSDYTVSIYASPTPPGYVVNEPSFTPQSPTPSSSDTQTLCSPTPHSGH